MEGDHRQDSWLMCQYTINVNIYDRIYWFVYAGMALFSKASIDKGMNPYIFVVYRQAFASLALAPFAFFLERKKAPPLSYILLCKIFLVSLCGLTLSLNLYYAALNYTSATFAAATTNVIPAITFIMAVLMRIERTSLKHQYGVAKVLGTVTCVSGALLVALYKGPSIKFMNWYPSVHNEVSQSSLINSRPKMEWVKGSLIMLSAYTAWSSWLILQGPIMKIYPAKLRLINLQCAFSCIQSAILALILNRNPSSWKLGWDIHLLSVAYCGLIVTGITYWLQVWCIEKRGPVFTSLFTPLALLITAIFSAFIWKETLHWGSVGGAILLVGGLYSVLWGKKKEKEVETSGTNEPIQNEAKEEIKLECITHH
ncbi:hypothetical protein NE237_017614 [Protea cynaroides]|uniref:WAT1-related protein n=1 Tax=Protea cynaroides TaxID=273540 RepID=A0A9Q0K8E9_9MAGN|nr:hypothetical protein NE237_017614 [Protea cynaroides]